MAEAQDSREQARTLFEEGVEAAASEDWETAVSRFEEALSLHAAPSIEYNLAAAYAEVDRLGEAGDLTASIFANPDTPPDVNEAARELDAEIADRAGTLTVSVSGEGSTGAQVFIDGRELPDTRLGIPRHESPGAREVSVARIDGTSEERTVEVTAGESATASFSGTDALSGDTSGQSTGADPRDGALTNPIFWGIVGGSVVIIVVAAIVLAASAPSSAPASAGMPLLEF